MPKNPKTTPSQQPPTVFCGQCRHFVRDTSGPNYSNDTHEYFMGVCGRGLTPDGCKKVFANKPRICSVYINL